jgi:hypothetical protein
MTQDIFTEHLNVRCRTVVFTTAALISAFLRKILAQKAADKSNKTFVS